MTPGRDLDALVAEKVMGWTPRGPHPLFGTPVFHQTVSCEGDNLLPRFSISVTAAFDVEARMREQGWLLTLSVIHGAVKPWYVCFERHGVTHTTTAETPAAAICATALKALGVEVPA